MKTPFRIFLSAFIVLQMTAGFYAKAQIEEIGNMMSAGSNDAQKLIQPYLSPAVNGFGAAMGGGWYTTAGTHKLGGFDLTFSVNTAFIPKEYRTFEIDNSELTVFQAAQTTTPSIAGKKDGSAAINYVFDNNGTPYTIPAFNMPEGLNTRMVPAPTIQLGIGLIKGTEVMVRYLPNFRIKGNEIGLWGIGGKHDIKQWIPGLKKAPVLKMSIMYGYTKLHTYVNMAVTPGTIGADGLSGADSYAWEDQKMKMVVRSQTACLLVGADLKVVSFYGGLGFVTTKTNLDLKGVYPLVTYNLTTMEPEVVASDPDPLHMSIKNQDGGVTKPRFNAGIRFKMAVVTINFDYSWANYSVLTAGLGISFR